MDREKVIEGLRHCTAWAGLHECQPKFGPDCPYEDEADCKLALMRDAISVIIEQKAISAHWDDDTEHWIEGDRDGIDPHTRTTGEMIDTFRCSWCGFYLYWKTPFCPNCGAKMESQ